MNPLLIIVPLAGLLAMGGKKSAPQATQRPPPLPPPITRGPRVVAIHGLSPQAIRAAVSYALNYETDTWNLNDFAHTLIQAGWPTYGQILQEKTNYIDDDKPTNTLVLPPPPPPPIAMIRGKAVRRNPTLSGGSMSLSPSMGPLPNYASSASQGGSPSLPSMPRGGSGGSGGSSQSGSPSPDDASQSAPTDPSSSPTDGSSLPDASSGDGSSLPDMSSFSDGS